MDTNHSYPPNELEKSDKLADYTSDIFKRLDKKYAREKQFKTKVVELFRKHNIGTPEEIAYLEGLSKGT